MFVLYCLMTHISAKKQIKNPVQHIGPYATLTITRLASYNGHSKSSRLENSLLNCALPSI